MKEVYIRIKAVRMKNRFISRMNNCLKVAPELNTMNYIYAIILEK